jgi:hypothetical protein
MPTEEVCKYYCGCAKCKPFCDCEEVNCKLCEIYFSELQREAEEEDLELHKQFLHKENNRETPYAEFIVFAERNNAHALITLAIVNLFALITLL